MFVYIFMMTLSNIMWNSGQTIKALDCYKKNMKVQTSFSASYDYDLHDLK
jgi:hypothetical protein